MSQERNTREGRPTGRGQGDDGPDAAPLLARPLTPRSIVASLLLGMHPPRMDGARLVRWCSRFGVAEGTTRVALSRMVARGELRVSDGVYELAGRVRGRQAVQEFALAPALERWDGHWVLHVVTADARDASTRAALRDAARALRLAEQREGLWLRPDNLPSRAAPSSARAVVDAQCRTWRAVPDDDARELAAALFPLAAWASRAEVVRERLDAVVPALERDEERALVDGFVLGAAALVELRADPLLPDALLPTRWPGPALRDAYRRFQPAFAQATARWFRAPRRAPRRESPTG